MTANKPDSSNGTNEPPENEECVVTVEVTLKYLDALRKAVGLHINPDTAEVSWAYRRTLDPYGDHPDLPEELRQVGRECFARSPGSDVWIAFCDLPGATQRKLWEKHEAKLVAFRIAIREEDFERLLAADET